MNDKHAGAPVETIDDASEAKCDDYRDVVGEPDLRVVRPAHSVFIGN